MDKILQADREVHITKISTLLHYAKLFITCTGNWPECVGIKWKLLLAFNFITAVIIFIWQHIFLTLNPGNFEWIIGVYSTLMTVIQVFIKHVSFLHKRKLVLKMLHTVRYEFWPINSFDNFPEIWSTMIIVTNILKLYAFLGSLVVQIWMLIPFVDPLPGQRKMPILCWYPFDVNKSPVHEIAYAWIDSCGFFVSFGIMGYDMLFAFFLMNIIAQYNLLKTALRSINTKGYGVTDERKIYEEMKFCVNHHLKISRFCDDVREMYDANNTMQLFTAGSCICILFFLIGAETDSIKQGKLLVYLLCAIIQMSIYCMYGSILQEQSELVAFAAYESGWYDTHPRLRLGLIQIIQAAHRPEILTASGMADINNETLVMVLRTAFSFATLLGSLNE